MKNSRKLIFLFGVLIIQINAVKAQAPTITAIDFRDNYPNEVMVINGLNYDADFNKMKVLFGGVEGKVLSSDGTTLEVAIPGNASVSNIHVINTTNGLSVFSSDKFFTTFHGSSFNVNDLQDPILLNSLGELFDVCSCDFDGDGLRDVATSKSKNDTNLEIAHNITTDPSNIQFNISTFNVNVTSRNITCGDLNGDGKPEIIFGRRDTGNRNFVYVLLNTSTLGNISFSSNTILQMATGSNAIRILVNDLDFDGKPDVVVTNSASNEISIFKNQSSGGTISFATSPIQIAVENAFSTAGIEMQDLDGDKKPELVVTQFSDNNIYVLKNNSGVNSISFEDAVQFDLPKSVRNVKVGDLNGDGLADIAITHTIENSLSIVINKSTATALDFELAGNWGTNFQPFGIDLGDMDGDGDLDVVVSNNGSNTLNVFVNNTTDPSAINLSSNTKDVPVITWNMVIADMNNDDKPDILYTTATERVDNVFFHVGVIRNTNCFVPEIRGDATRFRCDQPIELNAIHNNAAVFNWYKDDVLVQGPAHATNTVNASKFSAAEVGVYKVLVEAEQGACNKESNWITVNQASGAVPGAPIAVNDGPGCEGEDITLNVQFSGTPPAGLTYEWSGPNGFSSTVINPVISNVSPEDVGSYTVIVASGQCETNEVSTVVEVTSLPQFSVAANGDVAFCSGGTIALSVNSLSGHSYQWLLNGSPISGETGVNYTSADAGIYSVEVTDQVTSCSIVTNGVELFIFSTPVANIALPTTFCLDEDLAFSTEGSAIDDTATTVYQWVFDNGATSVEEAPVVSYITSGQYQVQLTIDYEETSCPSVVTETITIVAPELLIIESSSDGVCGTDDVELTTNIMLTNPIWSNSETTLGIIINAADTYSVSGSDVNGCLVAAEITLQDKEVPRIRITATPESIVSGDVVDLFVTGADTYLWSPAESLDDPAVADPVAKPEVTTTYTVLGSITDGCDVLDSVTIDVRPAISTAYKVLNKNAADQEKRVLTFENKGEPSTCTLVVFDRYGSKVFEDEGDPITLDNANFYNSLPQDTYFFVYKCDNAEPATGSILLIGS